MTKTTANLRYLDIELADRIRALSKELTDYRVKQVDAVPALSKIYDQHIKVLEKQLARLSK